MNEKLVKEIERIVRGSGSRSGEPCEPKRNKLSQYITGTYSKYQNYKNRCHKEFSGLDPINISGSRTTQ